MLIENYIYSLMESIAPVWIAMLRCRQAFKDPAFPRGRLVELLKLVAAKGGATELADVLQLVTKGEAHGR